MQQHKLGWHLELFTLYTTIPQPLCLNHKHFLILHLVLHVHFKNPDVDSLIRSIIYKLEITISSYFICLTHFLHIDRFFIKRPVKVQKPCFPNFMSLYTGI